MSIQRLNQSLERFLHKNISLDRPVLLGFSGGPDSVALLHLLLACQKKMPQLKLGIAHVNHNWRAESLGEALSAQKIAETYQIPFHLLTLDPAQKPGNLEATCRQERMNFFHRLSIEHGYQGVFLAHHADDQTETVLKRVLEGSTLTNLKGIQSTSHFNGLKLMRPLLSFSKQDLLDYLALHELDYFKDTTNLDPKFLRGKFRSQIIPQLSQQFGKAIAPALLDISNEAGELHDYLEQRLQPCLEHVRKGWMGLYLNLNLDFADYEVKYLIRHLSQCAGFAIQRPLVELALALHKQNAANKWVANGQGKIFVDRKHLFFIKKQHPKIEFQSPIILETGEYRSGNMHILVDQFCKIGEKENNCDWTNVWLGEMEVELPAGKYCLEMLVSDCPYQNGNSIYKWWNAHKVPCLLRQAIPVVMDMETGLVAHEFLSGKTKNKGRQNSYRIQVKIEDLT